MRWQRIFGEWIITTFHNISGIATITVFMNGDSACLATGDDARNVEHWME